MKVLFNTGEAAVSRRQAGRVQESYLCRGLKNSPQMLLLLPPQPQCGLPAPAVVFPEGARCPLTYLLQKEKHHGAAFASGAQTPWE